MEWIRCNKCYRAMIDSTRSFSLTQCGHIFCSRCFVVDAENECPECKTVGVPSIILDKDPKLMSTISCYAPLERHLERTTKAARFQEEQMAITRRGLQEIETKYERTKNECQKLTDEIEAIADGYAQLKIVSERLKSELEAESN